MVLGALALGLGSLGVLSFGLNALEKKKNIVLPSHNDVDSVFENSKTFNEKYMNESVVNSDSPEPFISSPEQSRPQHSDIKYKATGNNDDDSPRARSWGGGLLTGAWLVSSLDENNGGVNWKFVIGVALGVYLSYKVLSDG